MANYLRRRSKGRLGGIRLLSGGVMFMLAALGIDYQQPSGKFYSTPGKFVTDFQWRNGFALIEAVCCALPLAAVLADAIRALMYGSVPTVQNIKHMLDEVEGAVEQHQKQAEKNQETAEKLIKQQTKHAKLQLPKTN